MKQQNQVAETTLQYKPRKTTSGLPSASNTEQAYKIFLQNCNKDTLQLREEFKVMLLNPANIVLGIVPISSGGIDSTVADPVCCSFI